MAYNKIEVLSEKEHIRNAPAMYIGSTKTPTHLVEEVLDNALDEVLAKHASTVAIRINDSEITIVDDGRGIPINDDIPLTICTKLFSGGKFKGKKKDYKITTGRHGVGLVAVNFLSTKFNIEIYRDNKRYYAEFKNGELIKKELTDFNEKKPFSTGITFSPDPKIFETLNVDIDRINERLLYASLFTEGMFILLVNNEKKFIQLNKDEFLKTHMFNEKDTIITDIFSLNSKVKGESFSVDFAFAEGNISPRIIGGVNLLPIHNGEHILAFKNAYKTEILKFAKRNKIKFLDENDIFIGLRAFVNVLLEEVEFGGQNKGVLSNRTDYFNRFKIHEHIKTVIEENAEAFKKILKYQKDYRSHLEHNRKIKTKIKKGSTKFTKLRDCLNLSGELFIVEGDSAAGGLIECRDPKKHAVFPLKGKPPLFTSKTILKNNEISELIEALGSGIGNQFNIDNLKYDKIIISTDADADGGHIFCLVTMFFYKFLPDIIKENKLYYVVTPLYAISDVNKKIFIPLWTNEELEKARKENKHIIRIKGLGEMSPWQLKQVLIDEHSRRLIPIEYSNDINIEKLFTDSQSKRDLINE